MGGKSGPSASAAASSADAAAPGNSGKPPPQPQRVPKPEEISDAIRAALDGREGQQGAPPSAGLVRQSLSAAHPEWKISEKRVSKLIKKTLKGREKASSAADYDEESAAGASASEPRKRRSVLDKAGSSLRKLMSPGRKKGGPDRDRASGKRGSEASGRSSFTSVSDRDGDVKPAAASAAEPGGLAEPGGPAVPPPPTPLPPIPSSPPQEPRAEAAPAPEDEAKKSVPPLPEPSTSEEEEDGEMEEEEEEAPAVAAPMAAATMEAAAPAAASPRAASDAPEAAPAAASSRAAPDAPEAAADADKRIEPIEGEQVARIVPAAAAQDATTEHKVGAETAEDEAAAAVAERAERGGVYHDEGGVDKGGGCCEGGSCVVS